MIKFLNQREQKIFLLCLISMFTALLYHGLIVPMQNEQRNLDENIVMHQKQIEESVQIIKRGDKIAERYEQYTQKLLVSGNSEEIASSILSDIEKTARKLGIRVMDLKPQKVQNNEMDNYFSVSLTANSALVDIVHFLYVLQRAPYLLDVEKMEFAQSSRRGQDKLTTRLILSKMFVLAEKEKVNRMAEVTRVPRKPFKTYEDLIKKRKLFQPLSNVASAETKALKKAMPALHKRIKLIGILMDNDSKAIVEDLREKQTHFVSQGERVGTVLLEHIQEDKVIFDDNGRKVEMAL